jgi:hypothetical protein
MREPIRRTMASGQPNECECPMIRVFIEDSRRWVFILVASDSGKGEEKRGGRSGGLIRSRLHSPFVLSPFVLGDPILEVSGAHAYPP